MFSTAPVCVSGTHLARREIRRSVFPPPRAVLRAKQGSPVSVFWKAKHLTDRRLCGISVAFAAKFKSSFQARNFRQQRRRLGSP